jgi:hypothetical protein
MTQTIIKELAAKFFLSEDEVLAEGMKAFLHRQLHTLEAERQHIFAKYGVKNFEALDAYVTARPGNESALLPDFQRADYLTDRVKEVKTLLADLKDHD